MTTNSVSKEQIEAMIVGLEGVTPGPWSACPGDDYYISAAAYPNAYSHRCKSDDLGGMLAEIGNRPSDYGEANAAHIARCDPNTMRSILTELLSLRTSSCGVTSGEVVTDNLRRAANSLLDQLWQAIYTAAKTYEENWREMERRWPASKWLHEAAKTGALSSLHAQPEPSWGDSGPIPGVDFGDEFSPEPQGAGSREAVAWISPSGALYLPKHGDPDTDTPLVPLSQLQAVERELSCRDALIKEHLATILRLENRVEAADHRAKTTKTSLDVALKALEAAEERDAAARFRANSPRQDAEVRHLRTEAISSARAALAGGNG